MTSIDSRRLKASSIFSTELLIAFFLAVSIFVYTCMHDRRDFSRKTFRFDFYTHPIASLPGVSYVMIP